MNNHLLRGLKLAIPISLIMWALFILATLMLFGCANIVPSYIAPEFEHISHVTQHEPFTNSPTHYGANLANVVIGYDLPYHLNLELAEGISLDKRYAQSNQSNQWGEVAGPREQFGARLRYIVEMHK
jgi:hypothetical protein